MPITMLNPYLFFNGTAAEAIKLYERALGAKVEALMRFGDVAEVGATPENKDRVMHAMLRVGGQALMLSDSMPNMPVSGAPGQNCVVCLNFDDPAELRARFDALSAGGKITMPPHDTFYGGVLGNLVDAYGIGWMMNWMPAQKG